jgi:hypothetical protein
MKTSKLTALGIATVAILGAGIGVAANLPDSKATASAAKGAPVADMLAARSPGARSSAAVSSKPLRTAWTPTFPSAVSRQMSSSDSIPADAPKLAMASPVPAQAYAPAAIAATPAPVTAIGAAGAPAIGVAPAPVAVASAAGTPAILAAAPVAAAAGGGSLAGAAVLLPAIPILLASGGGNNGGGQSMTAAVPEPSTWLMMISGFGVLGFALRRRRRQLREGVTPGQASEPSNGLALARAS